MAIVTEFSTALNAFAAVDNGKSYDQMAKEQMELPVVVFVYADEHQDKDLLLSLNFLLHERIDIVRSRWLKCESIVLMGLGSVRV